jgi:hypothetical protein
MEKQEIGKTLVKGGTPLLKKKLFAVCFFAGFL